MLSSIFSGSQIKFATVVSVSCSVQTRQRYEHRRHKFVIDWHWVKGVAQVFVLALKKLVK
ncbi:MAG: hypothetical protein DCC55_14935 [Chloroflexi bacterium]|nr:MAG: hypothetical protein DCC55_14935 [Chloroflexota bacterium]